MRLKICSVLIAAGLAACGGGGGGGGMQQPNPTQPVVNGPAWWGYGRDAQHSAKGAIATQSLKRIVWQAVIDRAPPLTNSGALLAHYGSPVITSHNTVVVPVKTGAAGGFRVEARAGGNGVLLWSADTDYVMPAHNWAPKIGRASCRERV